MVGNCPDWNDNGPPGEPGGPSDAVPIKGDQKLPLLAEDRDFVPHRLRRRQLQRALDRAGVALGDAVIADALDGAHCGAHSLGHRWPCLRCRVPALVLFNRAGTRPANDYEGDPAYLPTDRRSKKLVANEI